MLGKFIFYVQNFVAVSLVGYQFFFFSLLFLIFLPYLIEIDSRSEWFDCPTHIQRIR